jgi:Primase C terminal 1 (PriCT-1)
MAARPDAVQRIRYGSEWPKRTPTQTWVRLLRNIPEGQRNDSLARIVGHLLARGVDEHVALELLLAVNQARCRPPLPDREVVAVAESILRRHLRKAAA